MKAIIYIVLILGIALFIIGLWPLISPILLVHDYPDIVASQGGVVVFIWIVVIFAGVAMYFNQPKP